MPASTDNLQKIKVSSPNLLKFKGFRSFTSIIAQVNKQQVVVKTHRVNIENLRLQEKFLWTPISEGSVDSFTNGVRIISLIPPSKAWPIVAQAHQRTPCDEILEV